MDEVRLVFTGSQPHLSNKTEILIGERPNTGIFAEAAKKAVAELDPESDIHASTEYRREVAQVLARRVLESAAARAAKQLSEEEG
jgi:CO/xanthine dehydrogenase FAD-binding subunit